MGERREPVPGRERFRHWQQVPTRWMDNDVYGHVNNVTYYSYIDTVVNRYLIGAGVLDPVTSEVFGVVAETSCRFLEPVGFPEVVEAGLRVQHLGRTSVTYEVGLFREGSATPAAVGRFVHVYVDRATRRPQPLPDDVRAVLSTLIETAVDGGVPYAQRPADPGTGQVLR